MPFNSSFFNITEKHKVQIAVHYIYTVYTYNKIRTNR